MVDLLGMFRRRPAKRSPPGFARSRVDITALNNSIGEMLTSPDMLVRRLREGREFFRFLRERQTTKAEPAKAA